MRCGGPSPRGAWELVLRELFRGVEGQLPEAPSALRRPTGANETGGKSEEEEEEEE